MSEIVNYGADANGRITETLPDHIEDWWCVDDVLELDESLTDRQARLVLQRVEQEFDANYGINWEVIGDTIRAMRDGGEL